MTTVNFQLTTHEPTASQAVVVQLKNLSALPREAVEAVRRTLKGEHLVGVEDAFEIVENGSRAHGHVDAVRQAMKRLDFERLIASRPSRERDLVAAMVAARILEPQSKLATTRWWGTTTLPDLFGVAGADEEDAQHPQGDLPNAQHRRRLQGSRR